MDNEQVLAYIDAHQAEYVDLLGNLCALEATAYDKEELDRMVDFIAEYATDAGFSVQRTPMQACGDFLTVDLNMGAPKHSVFLAHMDTVHQKGRFGSPAVRVENGRMIAPGAIDCKGGIAIALLCMKALRECGYDKHVRLILTSDEEVSNVLGGEAEMAFFRERVQGFSYALNCETTKRGEAVVSRKGILRYEVTVQGSGGHAGIFYFEAKNPVVEAAHKILALEGSSSREGATFSCNVIRAGSASNVIPDSCTFSVDVRVSTRAEMEGADRLVREMVAKSYLGGTSAQITLLGHRPPMEKTARSVALLEHLSGISKSLGFGPLTSVCSGGGSDSAYTQLAGVTSLCGLGAEGDFCHTDREYAEIGSIARRAKLLATLLCEEVYI